MDVQLYQVFLLCLLVTFFTHEWKSEELMC